MFYYYLIRFAMYQFVINTHSYRSLLIIHTHNRPITNNNFNFYQLYTDYKLYKYKIFHQIVLSCNLTQENKHNKHKVYIVDTILQEI